MVKRSVYATGGDMTPAVAPRPRSGRQVSASWLIGADVTATTQMFADVPNHRTRWLSERSP